MLRYFLPLAAVTGLFSSCIQGPRVDYDRLAADVAGTAAYATLPDPLDRPPAPVPNPGPQPSPDGRPRPFRPRGSEGNEKPSTPAPIGSPSPSLRATHSSPHMPQRLQAPSPMPRYVQPVQPQHRRGAWGR